MRILILNHNLRERGTFFRAMKTARFFHGRGHEVWFVGTGERYYRSAFIEKSERWTWLETANWSLLREKGDGHSLIALLQRCYQLPSDFDLIYTFSHKPDDQFTARFKKTRGAFWMTDWCDLWNSRSGGILDTREWGDPLPEWIKGFKGKLVRNSFKREDRLEKNAVKEADATSIIVSPMRRYTRLLGVSDSNVLRYLSGCDTENIDVLDPQDCRKALGLKSDRLMMGYVANTTPDNQQLLGALKIVWEEFPDLEMISVGPSWYGSSQVIHSAIKRGVFHDFDRQPFARIPLYLGASDFLVMPLTDRPLNRCRWPNKFGDYMASGRGTASCDVGDMGAIIRKYQVGACGEPSSQGLASAILELARNREMRELTGQRARWIAEHKISWKQSFKKLRKFLHEHGLEKV